MLFEDHLSKFPDIQRLSAKFGSSMASLQDMYKVFMAKYVIRFCNQCVPDEYVIFLFLSLSMSLSCLPFILLLLSPHIVLSSDCEVCDLTDQLTMVKRELADCQVKVTDQSYIGQVCSRVGSWIGKDSTSPRLKSTVQKLLARLDLLSSPLDPKSKGVERDIIIKLSNQELRDLRKFVLNDDGSPGHVEDILVRSLHNRDGWLDQTSDFVSQTFGETSLHFKANYVIIFQVSKSYNLYISSMEHPLPRSVSSCVVSSSHSC